MWDRVLVVGSGSQLEKSQSELFVSVTVQLFGAVEASAAHSVLSPPQLCPGSCVWPEPGISDKVLLLFLSWGSRPWVALSSCSRLAVERTADDGAEPGHLRDFFSWVPLVRGRASGDPSPG